MINNSTFNTQYKATKNSEPGPQNPSGTLGRAVFKWAAPKFRPDQIMGQQITIKWQEKKKKHNKIN